MRILTLKKVGLNVGREVRRGWCRTRLVFEFADFVEGRLLLKIGNGPLKGTLGKGIGVPGTRSRAISEPDRSWCIQQVSGR